MRLAAQAAPLHAFLLWKVQIGCNRGVRAFVVRTRLLPRALLHTLQLHRPSINVEEVSVLERKRAARKKGLGFRQPRWRKEKIEEHTLYLFGWLKSHTIYSNI